MGNPWGRAGRPEEKEVIEANIETPVATMPEPIKQPEKNESAASAPVVLLSETDAYLHERMKEQPKTDAEVNLKVMQDFENKGHILSLPKDLEVFCKDYSFRWINKKKRAIDHALDVIGWSFVNRVMFKTLPKHLFTANGSIERGDAILAFMPRKRAEEIRLRPAQISRERVRNTPVQPLDRPWEDRGEKYYKPDLGAAENDNEKPVGISVTPDTDIRETEQ
jgi:hypothetical protein